MTHTTLGFTTREGGLSMYPVKPLIWLDMLMIDKKTLHIIKPY